MEQRSRYNDGISCLTNPFSASLGSSLRHTGITRRATTSLRLSKAYHRQIPIGRRYLWGFDAQHRRDRRWMGLTYTLPLILRQPAHLALTHPFPAYGYWCTEGLPAGYGVTRRIHCIYSMRRMTIYTLWCIYTLWSVWTTYIYNRHAVSFPSWGIYTFTRT